MGSLVHSHRHLVEHCTFGEILLGASAAPPGEVARLNGAMWQELRAAALRGTLERMDFIRAASMMSRVGDLDGCLQFLGFMVRCGIKLDRTAMNHVVLACSKRGNVRVAEMTFDFMIAEGLQPNRTTYCNITAATVAGRWPAKTELWLQRMRDANICVPRCFMWRLMRIVRNVAESVACFPGRKRMMVQLEASWLEWFVLLKLTLDRHTGRYLLNTLCREMYVTGVEPSPIVTDCFVSAVLNSAKHHRERATTTTYSEC